MKAIYHPSAVDNTAYARSLGYSGSAPVLVLDGRVISHKGAEWSAFCETLRAAGPAYLRVGSATFARTPALLTESLFNAGGTASGMFRVRKGGILFLSGKGEPFAFLVANRHGERFFVSCSRHDNGKIVYAFGLGSGDESALGLSGMGYSAQGAEASRVWDLVSNKAEGRAAA